MADMGMRIYGKITDNVITITWQNPMPEFRFIGYYENPNTDDFYLSGWLYSQQEDKFTYTLSEDEIEWGYDSLWVYVEGEKSSTLIEVPINGRHLTLEEKSEFTTFNSFKVVCDIKNRGTYTGDITIQISGISESVKTISAQNLPAEIEFSDLNLQPNTGYVVIAEGQSLKEVFIFVKTAAPGSNLKYNCLISKLLVGSFEVRCEVIGTLTQSVDVIVYELNNRLEEKEITFTNDNKVIFVNYEDSVYSGQSYSMGLRNITGQLASTSPFTIPTYAEIIAKIVSINSSQLTIKLKTTNVSDGYIKYYYKIKKSADEKYSDLPTLLGDTYHRTDFSEYTIENLENKQIYDIQFSCSVFTLQYYPEIKNILISPSEDFYSLKIQAKETTESSITIQYKIEKYPSTATPTRIDFYLNDKVMVIGGGGTPNWQDYTFSNLNSSTTYTIYAKSDSYNLTSSQLYITTASPSADFNWHMEYQGQVITKEKGQPIPNINGKICPISAEEWNEAIGIINSKKGTSISSVNPGDRITVGIIKAATNALNLTQYSSLTKIQVSEQLFKDIKDAINNL